MKRTLALFGLIFYLILGVYAQDFYSTCTFGTLQDVKSALAKGADVNTDFAKGNGGVTPLNLALVCNRNEGVIAFLIKSGANVNIHDKAAARGKTPLMFAAIYWEGDQIINLLINAGAKINDTDDDGNTPLMCAARTGSPEATLALLLAGANANAKNNKGENAFELAKYNTDISTNTNAWKKLAIATLTFSAFGYICEEGTGQDVIEYLKNGANVNANDKDGITPLMYAADYANDPEVITALVNAGAKLNSIDKYGYTPLMHAAQNTENPEIVLELLKAGADAKPKNKDEKTAFDLASNNKKLMGTEAFKQLEVSGTFFAVCKSGTAKEVQNLLAAGANVGDRDENGNTPLMWACPIEHSPGDFSAFRGWSKGQ